jgi:hypothetical protein
LHAIKNSAFGALETIAWANLFLDQVGVTGDALPFAI